MAHKIHPKMKANLKFRYGCSKSLGIKPFKKLTAKQKKAVNDCVAKKARAAGMRMSGAEKK